MRFDLALEGGGIRGIAYAGALAVFEREGWECQRAAGTSAGAIAAALVACGYSAADILRVMSKTDFSKFRDFSWNPLARWRYAGFCRGDAFEKWLRELVGDRTMSQTRKPLSVVAVDLRNRQVLKLTSASHPTLQVAKAVRMSMSIPHFFFRVDWQDGQLQRQCVDGGVCLNYPIEVFDVAGVPRWPTIGFALDEPPQLPAAISGHASQARALVDMMRSGPAQMLDEHNAYRSVRIGDGGIDWLKFSLSLEEQQLLIRNGSAAAEDFLRRWKTDGGFDSYVSRFRAA